MSETDPGGPGRLYVVATPIGNLEDMTYRAVRLLGEVDLIACEDTREAAKLLSHYKIKTPTVSLHEHNETGRIPEMLRRIKEQGQQIALTSDAGTPLVNDPGFQLVRSAVSQGIQVIPIPGANAAITALSAAGLPTDAFYFAGYLPPKRQGRLNLVEKLKNISATLIFYETPHRIKHAIVDLIEGLGDRQAVMGREMTKIYETFYRGRLSEIAERLDERVRGEITLLIVGAGLEKMDREMLAQRVAEEAADPDKPLKAIASELAELSGWPKREIYQMALALRTSEEGNQSEG